MLTQNSKAVFQYFAQTQERNNNFTWTATEEKHQTWSQLAKESSLLLSSLGSAQKASLVTLQILLVRKMQQRKRALLIMCCKFQQREDLSRQPGTTKAWLWGAPHNQKSYSSVKSSHLYSGIEMKNTLWDVQLSFLLRKSTAWNSKVPANDCLFSVGFLLVWQEGVYKWTEFGSAMQAGKLKSLTNSIGWGRDPMQDRCKHMGDFPFRGQRLNLKDTYAQRLRFRLGLHLLQQSTAR